MENEKLTRDGTAELVSRDQPGTDPMAYGALNKNNLDAAAEVGRNLVIKHQIQPERGE